jgi:glycosyltransferase involved in cell wall biosynthesis
MHQLTPRLSIGVPVYNGENYLAEAIDSLLAQSYDDFEIVISDNASTDRTAEICQDYAARDARVRYHRNANNIGSGPNFDMAFKLSSDSEYFKWAAHDDVLSPTFLEKCVAALDADQEAVLSHSLVALIDTNSNVTDIYDPKLPGTRSLRASDRFAAIVLPVHMSTDFFGIIRRTALEEAPLIGSCVNSDQVVLAALALRGRFVQIPEPLFCNRSHPQRYSARAAYHLRSSWWDSSKTGRIEFPLWRQYAAYVCTVREGRLQAGDRFRCYGHLARWWLVNWNTPRMAIDLISNHFPQAFPKARQLKHRLFGRRNLGFDWDRWHGADRS